MKLEMILSKFRASFSRVWHFLKFSHLRFFCWFTPTRRRRVRVFFVRALWPIFLNLKKLEILIIAGIYKENPTLALKRSNKYAVWKHKFSNITLLFSR